MKKLFILATAAVLALTSCSSDKNENTTAASNSLILPKKSSYVSATDPTENETFAFVYNGSKIVSTTSTGGSSVVYTYSGDLITEKAETSYGETTFTDYTYSDGKLTSINQQTSSSPNVFFDKARFAFTYNSDGTVTENQYSIDNQGNEDLIYIVRRTIANGNITKEETLDITDEVTVTTTTTYEYDDKNNPTRNVLGMDKILVAGESEGLSNETKHTHYEGSNPDPQVYTSTYTYNAQGYPTESKSYKIDGTLSSTQTFNY